MGDPTANDPMALASDARLRGNAECFVQLPGGGQPLPLRISANRSLCFKPGVGRGRFPAFVLSLPKAGTYLVGQVLAALGLVDAEVHIGLNAFTDYREMNRAEKLARARLRNVVAPLELSAGLILEGQFGVGHVAHEWRSVEALGRFRKVFVTRAWRDCLVSFMRFEARRIAVDAQRFPPEKMRWVNEASEPAQMIGFLRAFGAEHSGVAESMVGWLTDPAVLRVRFEDLLGDSGRDRQLQLVNDIAAHLELDIVQGPEAVLDACLGTETPTWSGSRSVVERVWSRDAESLFRQLGGEGIEAAFRARAAVPRDPSRT